MSGRVDLEHTSLRERAREALADDHVRGALRRATDLRQRKQEAGQAGLDNFDELRDAARRLRHEAIRRLPELLDQLATNVESAGGIVHFAADAAEARAAVVAIARRRGARLAVKSKSMVTEEIGLNAALQEAGVEAVETDLGEFIQQLAGDPPFHIITPAIDKTREDVRRLFQEIAAGDRQLSEVPDELCAFAREHLRQKFLDADLGISGCNLAVAETGTISIVTNEGNGRLVTSVPPVHVVVMGMERVVANWAELDVLFSLLPRAAAGQDITVYTNHVTGPRRDGEIDGPEELHLVIVDNGRAQLIGTAYQEMLHCIRCGACLNACPVYRQVGGHTYSDVYSGPMGAVLTPLLRRTEAAAELAQASSLCGACHETCPVKIPLQDLLLELRQDHRDERPAWERAAWRGWSQAWSRPAAYRASTRMAAALGRVLPTGLFPDAWAAGRDVPRPTPGPSFREWLRGGGD